MGRELGVGLRLQKEGLAVKRKLICLLHLFYFAGLLSQAKIVGLVPVRNEAQMIVPCLKALAMYTDAIVVLDDASEDGTVAAVQALQKECHIERIIEKKVWYRDEPGDRNLLLQAGREIGGTHFIVIDADEMFTANLLKDNFLRNKVLALQSGERLQLTLINLWRSVNQYRYDYSVWSGAGIVIGFCDDGICSYKSGFLHTSRTPSALIGAIKTVVVDDHDFSFLNNCLDKYGYPIIRRFIGGYDGKYDRNNIQLQRYFQDQLNNYQVPLAVAARRVRFDGLFWPSSGHSRIGCYQHDFTAGLMHFQFVNWDNLLSKQAWYRCLEKIRDPKIDVKQINKMYGESKDEKLRRCLTCPQEWFAGYGFFDKTIYEQNSSWQKRQVQAWFKEYGQEFFKDLDIWDVSWNA